MKEGLVRGSGANGGREYAAPRKLICTKTGVRPEHPPDPNIPAFWAGKGRRRRAVQCERAALSPTALAPSAARDGLPERGTKRGDLPNDVERPERTIRPERQRRPTAHFGVRRWAGAMSSNRRGEPTDVRGPSHMILIDAPWPQFWFNWPGMHNLGSTKSASTPHSAH